MIDLSLLLSGLPFLYFHFIGCITPGPNNIMLAASGMNFGIKRTIPHMVGIWVGFGSLLLLCMLGVGTLYETYPFAQYILKTFSAAYLIYLAYRIATTKRVKIDETVCEKKPLTFFEAAAFQYINPKAWVIGVTATSSFIPAEAPVAFKAALIIFAVAFISGATAVLWTSFGTMMAKVFKNDRLRTAINITLAILLLATIPMMIG